MSDVRPRIYGLALLGFLLPACSVGGGGTLTPTVAPGIPQQVTATGGNRRVTLTWISSGAATRFTVLRSNGSGGPYFPVSQPGQFPTPTSYVDLDVDNGTPYFYVVIAANAFGASPQSSEVTATPGFHPRSLASGTQTAHCLCLFDDGTVWGWGRNSTGQVGNGQQGFSYRPTLALNLPKVTALSRGSGHSIALANDGTVWSWGANNVGQLGDGNVSDTPSLTPLQVPGLSGITAVSAGGSHNLALRSDGTVWAWGSNSDGELGLGAASYPVTTPAKVPNLTGMTGIAAGGFFSMALRNDGTVWTCGRNQWGQIGNGSATPTSSVDAPYQVDNLNNVTDIAVGGVHCLALRNDGSVWAWGDNVHGQIGNGSTSVTPVTRPVLANNLSGVKAITAGGYYSLALKNDGTVWSWGDNLGDGALGNGSANGIVNAPAQILSLSGIGAIAGGANFGMALGSDGTTWVWGSNGEGQLAVSGPVETSATVVNNLTSATAVAAGPYYSAALRSDGTVWSWGFNEGGAVRQWDDEHEKQHTDQGVRPGQRDCLGSRRSARTGDPGNGSVWAWGWNQYGQIGNGSAAAASVSTPIQVNVLSGIFTAVSAGSNHSLALKSDGSVWAWGWNQYGQIGNGNTATPVANPVPVPGLTGMLAISAGNIHSLALRNDGTVWAWGNNEAGQMGKGTADATPVSSPSQVPGLSNITAIAAGQYFNLAVKNDGSVWAWGDNLQGQIGNGTNGVIPVTSPFQVPGISDVKAVAGGLYFSQALKNDGTVWGWGQNGSGELGDGTTTVRRTSPVQALGVSGVTSIESGFFHTLARLPNGLVYAWGANGELMLGEPIVTFNPTPGIILH
jgi:alpha-tubulin suppressor-like RCC1 family protein